MNKSELKTGMVVELVNGERYQVMLNTPHGDILQGVRYNTKVSYFMDLNYYNEDLNLDRNTEYSVVRVWGTESESARAYSAPFEKFTRLLWERPLAKKKITLVTVVLAIDDAGGEAVTESLAEKLETFHEENNMLDWSYHTKAAVVEVDGDFGYDCIKDLFGSEDCYSDLPDLEIPKL